MRLRPASSRKPIVERLEERTRLASPPKGGEREGEAAPGLSAQATAFARAGCYDGAVQSFTGHSEKVNSDLIERELSVAYYSLIVNVYSFYITQYERGYIL